MKRGQSTLDSFINKKKSVVNPSVRVDRDVQDESRPTPREKDLSTVTSTRAFPSVGAMTSSLKIAPPSRNFCIRPCYDVTNKHRLSTFQSLPVNAQNDFREWSQNLKRGNRFAASPHN